MKKGGTLSWTISYSMIRSRGWSRRENIATDRTRGRVKKKSRLYDDCRVAYLIVRVIERYSVLQLSPSFSRMDQSIFITVDS